MDQPQHEASSSIDLSPDASPSTELSPDASQPFVGRWNQLVSTTNWEKGRIIHQWRTAMIASDAPASEYSDEAWSRRVGRITGQHAGRLRRVYDRFGAESDQYEGLYWSHFQAALDWNDSEMWLEGAIQNQWSVSQMRRSRWETLGAVHEQEPRDEEIVPSETDEDFDPVAEDSPADQTGTVEEASQRSQPSAADKSASTASEPKAATGSRETDDGDGAAIYAEMEQPNVAFVRPFENLADLPADVSEAFENYKLAILQHKTAGWQEISVEDLLASLDALKELALAPPD